MRRVLQTLPGHTRIQAAGLSWDARQAHSAIYDAEITAALFCTIVNRWRTLSLNAPTASG